MKSILHLPEAEFVAKLLERKRLQEVIRNLSTGPHRGNGDAKDFAQRHGLSVKKVGQR